MRITSEPIYNALDQAFKESDYLHSVGTGNVMAVEHIIDDFKDIEIDPNNIQLRTALIGYVMGAAMVNEIVAADAVERIMDEIE